MTSQTYHFSITERNQENSCRPFRRTLTGRRRTPIKLAFS
ncbi:unnamed protein product [Brassica napus]|uniref:Uncharacterized protein n=2 Tax=Brassica TaxID=3705 RepID=A0A3P6B2B0_BRAOL|nr:unnamed protein product [Brassica napus]CAF2114435.1 unnamed protein product [Brassica napus]VDC94433.1 unnamed protein product [Brassica oleracea]